MPTYCYRCLECEEEFEARHSMSFEDQKCPACNSTSVFKIPSLSVESHRPTNTGRVGKVVDEYIQTTRKEIKKEKKKLKRQEL